MERRGRRRLEYARPAAGSRCALRTDIILHFSFTRADIRNPCPESYISLIDLPFSTQQPRVDSYMRVFVRKDLAYAQELRRSLADAWPAPFTRPYDWVAAYSSRYSRSYRSPLFFQ